MNSILIKLSNGYGGFYSICWIAENQPPNKWRFAQESNLGVELPATVEYYANTNDIICDAGLPRIIRSQFLGMLEKSGLLESNDGQ